MKKIFSKTLNARLDKEAGLWDAVKGVGSTLKDWYGKGKDVANKARLGWELGKTDFEPEWKQQLGAIQHKGLYPMTPDGKPIYIDESTGKPINPYYKPGLMTSLMQNRRNSGLPIGKTINPIYRKDPVMQGRVQEALSKLYNRRDSSMFKELEQRQIIINENQPKQPAAKQKATRPVAPTPIVPKV